MGGNASFGRASHHDVLQLFAIYITLTLMNDPVFLGLSKAQWELFNSFSSWLSAIGTIAAVVVSLWLASRSIRPKAKVSVGHRLVIQPGAKGKYPEIIVFSIVNTGDRPIRITGIGWKLGALRWRRQALQIHDALQSSPMPVELAHGQEATWTVPLLLNEEGWMASFPKKMLLPHWRVSCATLRATIFTSVGKTFVAKPEASLMSIIRKACAEAAK